MKTVAIVPARAGSIRLPGKNTRLLGGIPLIEWAIQAALDSKRISQLVVSSDCPQVLEIGEKYKESHGVAVLQRPSEISGSDSPAIEYVQHVLSNLDKQGNRFECVVIVQATSPFTRGVDIDATIDLFESSRAKCAVSVMKIDQVIHPRKLKRLTDDRLEPFFLGEEGKVSANELEDIYVRNGSVYVTDRSLIDAGKIIDEDCRGYVMPRELSVDINDIHDFLYAEFICRRIRNGELDFEIQNDS
ncbi:MAG: acylneuraminate cytidylyltransferase family protein [Opitutales bacterium]|nr:acylneuraminate cytidylyltransferase family protein [Opitutales bacterium]